MISKQLLIETKKLIDFHLDEFDDDFNSKHEYLKLMIESCIYIMKNIECVCDDYNGFNCGCETRQGLILGSIEELKKFK